MHNNPCTRCGVDRWQPYKSRAQRLSPICHSCSSRDTGRANARHGLERHPLYRLWSNMIRRVDHPKPGREARAYKGVTLEPDWRDVTQFYEWAVNAGWAPGLSIERRDNTDGYHPRNCRFIPVKFQGQNKRNNTITPAIAKEAHARIASGEVRYHVAKDIAFREGISLSTLQQVVYGLSWKETL